MISREKIAKKFFFFFFFFSAKTEKFSAKTETTEMGNPLYNFPGQTYCYNLQSALLASSYILYMRVHVSVSCS
jgi:hypothetical protein